MKVFSERQGAPRRRPGTPRHSQRDIQENAKGHPATHKAGQGATGDPQEAPGDPQWPPGGAQEATREPRNNPKRRPETPDDTQMARRGATRPPRTAKEAPTRPRRPPKRKNTKTLKAVKREHEKRRGVRCGIHEKATPLNFSMQKTSAL